MFIVDLAANFRKVTAGLTLGAFRPRVPGIEVNRLDRQIGQGGNPE